MGNTISSCLRRKGKNYEDISGPDECWEDVIDSQNFRTQSQEQRREHLDKNKSQNMVANSRSDQAESTSSIVPTHISQTFSALSIEPSSSDTVPSPNSGSPTSAVSSPGSSDPFMNFAFLKHSETIEYIKSSRTMLIMRGVSGSGKSTLVRAICKIYPTAVVCSADDYFMKDGAYRFKKEDLGSAHQWCQKLAEDACENNQNVVIIDNTNIRRWEMKFYMDLSREKGYDKVIVQPKTDWKTKPEELVSKSIHGVDLETIQRKIKTFEDYTPFYYAWFLNEKNSSDLYSSCLQTLTHCVQNIPQFMSFIMGDGYSKEDFWSHFGINKDSSGKLYHCTAKFLGPPKNPAVRRQEYHKSQIVQDSCGRCFKLHATGLIVTSSTVGIRICLSQDSLQLYDKPEEIERDRFLQQNGCTTELYPQRGRSAHITMGTARGIPAKQTNMDLLDVCDLEQNLSNVNSQVENFGTVYFLKPRFCSINFKEPIVFPSLFAGS